MKINQLLPRLALTCLLALPPAFALGLEGAYLHLRSTYPHLWSTYLHL